MAFVRLLKDLMKDKELGPRFVPIIPDEARTFGLDSLFPSHKIYSPHGQRYTSVDRELMLAYKEAEQGVILHEGINEAGSTASFTAAGTSYATHGEPMIPIYIFYSMFGFQRTGDGFWAAADQMTRGFLLGATAGRTTLNGEGLQHEDGHSLLLAPTNPAVVAYDPAFALRGRPHHRGRAAPHVRRRPGCPARRTPLPDVIYYLTVYNEPSPAGRAGGLDVAGPARRHVPVRRRARQTDGPKAQILASGIAVQWALRAQELLAQDWGVAADVWSVTSWTELRREADAGRPSTTCCTPEEEPQVPYVTRGCRSAAGPGRRGVGLDARRPRPDRAVRPARLHVAGHRRVRPVRHPPGAAPALPRRRRVDRRPHAGLARRLEPARPGRRPAGRGEVPDPRRAGRPGRGAAPTRAPRREHDDGGPGSRVTVVGGGVIGLTCALELARARHRVTVLTADPVEATTSAVAAALWFPYRAAPADAVLRWAAASLAAFTALAGRPGHRRGAAPRHRRPPDRRPRTCGGPRR